MGINVLSLFDGISCGQVALDRAGIEVDNYYASEIDKYPIEITQKNYPNTIQIGDVTKVNAMGLPNIDLLIGGGPCQGFSFAGKQLNFNDPRSALFFEFVRIYRELKKKNPKLKFLFENVKMKKEYKDIISGLLGVEPIEINSALVSAHNRKRLYWTNIPNVTQPKNRSICFKDIKSKSYSKSLIIPAKYKPTYNKQITINKDKSIRLGGYMKQGQGQRIYSMKGKSICLSALGGGWGAKTGLYLDGKVVRKPTVKELCSLQTIPCDYFKVGTYNKIAKALGNAWTVEVIVHIFRGLDK